MKTQISYHVVIIGLLVLIILLQVSSLGFFRWLKTLVLVGKRRRVSKRGNGENGGSCSKDTCGAIDDVNDPSYNMKNVIKQSILLEEHIAEKNKYCISCIVKHFNHIIGLCEEAVWLAERDREGKYPYLEQSVDYYTKLFEKWLAARNDERVKVEVLSALRERRRALIDAYYLL